MLLMEVRQIAQALRHCGRYQKFKHGKSVHSHFIKLGHANDSFVTNNLIYMYSDFCQLFNAQYLFDKMPERNVVTWTTMITAYTTAGYPNEALTLFTKMSESELDTLPNSFTFSAALKACTLARDLEKGKSIHASISSANLYSDTVLMNTLLDMYVKCGAVSDARRVFDVMLVPNLNSWNTIIAGYTKEGKMEEAVSLFCRMPEPDVVSWNTMLAGFVMTEDSFHAREFVYMMHSKGVRLDPYTFPCVLKICGCLKMGKQIHCYVVKCGWLNSCYAMSSLVDMYTDCSTIDEARGLFDEYLRFNGYFCSHDNLSVWNSMLSGYVLNGLNDAALRLTSRMHTSGAQLDCYTFSNVLKVCVNSLRWRLGLQIHAVIVTSGYELDYVVGSVLIDFYAKQGNVKDAMGLFRRLPNKDTVAWTGMITACSQSGLNSLAFSFFKDMISLEFDVDQFVLTSILKACSSLAGLTEGKQLHAYCVKNGFDAEVTVVTSLIDVYSKCGEIDDALMLFGGVTDRDIVFWTDMIVGCALNGRAEEAIGLYEKMLKSGHKPNTVTYLGILNACKHAGLVNEALMFFRCMREEGLEPKLEHYSCIIDLLGRAGCLEEVEKLMADLPCDPDGTIWGSLLSACTGLGNRELLTRIAKNLLDTFPGNLSHYVQVSNAYASLGMWDDSTKVRKLLRKVGMKEAGKSWIEVRC